VAKQTTSVRTDYSKLVFVAGIFIGLLPTTLVQMHDQRIQADTMNQVARVALKTCLGSRASLTESALEWEARERTEQHVAALFARRHDPAMSEAIQQRAQEARATAQANRRNAAALTCEGDDRATGGSTR